MLWTPAEEKFIELFYDIVELHYAKHIEDLEIKHVVSRYDGSDVHGQPIYRSQETTGPRQMLESDVDVSRSILFFIQRLNSDLVSL